MLISFGSWRAIGSSALKTVQRQEMCLCSCVFLHTPSADKSVAKRLRFLSTGPQYPTPSSATKLGHFSDGWRNDSTSLYKDAPSETSLVSRPSRFGTVAEEKEIILDFENPSRAAKRITKLHKAEYSGVDTVLNEVVTDLLASKRADPALLIVQDLVMKGSVTIPSDTYTRLLRDLVSKQKLRGGIGYAHQFLSFVLLMMENGYQHSATQNIEVLRMASLIGNGKLAQVCFDEIMSGKNQHLDGKNCSGLLFEAYINEARMKKRYSNMDGALYCFSRMIQESCEIHPRYIKQLIENLVRGSAPRKARSALRMLKTDRDVYLKYLDFLLEVQPYLVAGDFAGALRKSHGSQFHKDCNRFIRLYR